MRRALISLVLFVFLYDASVFLLAGNFGRSISKNSSTFSGSEVEVGSPLVVGFPARNISLGWIDILDVASSCNCSQFTASSGNVGPFRAVDMNFVINPVGVSGEQKVDFVIKYRVKGILVSRSILKEVRLVVERFSAIADQDSKFVLVGNRSSNVCRSLSIKNSETSKWDLVEVSQQPSLDWINAEIKFESGHFWVSVCADIDERSLGTYLDSVELKFLKAGEFVFVKRLPILVKSEFNFEWHPGFLYFDQDRRDTVVSVFGNSLPGEADSAVELEGEFSEGFRILKVESTVRGLQIYLRCERKDSGSGKIGFRFFSDSGDRRTLWLPFLFRS